MEITNGEFVIIGIAVLFLSISSSKRQNIGENITKPRLTL